MRELIQALALYEKIAPVDAKTLEARGVIFGKWVQCSLSTLNYVLRSVMEDSRQSLRVNAIWENMIFCGAITMWETKTKRTTSILLEASATAGHAFLYGFTKQLFLEVVRSNRDFGDFWLRSFRLIFLRPTKQYPRLTVQSGFPGIEAMMLSTLRSMVLKCENQSATNFWKQG